MVRYVVLFLLALFFLLPHTIYSQSTIPVEAPLETEKTTYSFEKLGLSIQLFSNWAVQDTLSNEALMGKGKNIIAGDNEKLLEKLSSGEDNITYLLTAFKYPLDSSSEYNPSIALVAEDLSTLNTPIDAEQYLMVQKQLLEQSQSGFRVRDGFQLKRISGQRFYAMHNFIKYGGVYIRQVHYTTIHRQHALSFIISYVDEQDQMALEEMIRTILVR